MTLVDALVAFSVVVTSYFVLWNTLQIVMGVIAVVFVWRYLRRRTPRNRALAARLGSPPVISIVVPAYNEALTVVDSIRALLALDYVSREIVVVNDGSTDDTLAVLEETFDLLLAPFALPPLLPAAAVRGVYRSTSVPELVVIDKENGGCKADAANAGINAASGVLVMIMDADTVLEPDALTRAVLPFLEDPTTAAVGGNVAVANGCRIEQGRITEVRLPRSWLARFQIVEYMRSFLLFRVACASANGVLLISGAFGLFRRDALIAVGGFDRAAIGEDMDLTVRLQEFYRVRGKPVRIAFDPYPLCSTQVPEDLRSLRSQRCRWRRGLLQVLWRRRQLIANPRAGVIGLGVLPYIAVFEGIGPLLEVSGYAITGAAAIAGLIDWSHFWVLMVASLVFGAAVTLLAVLLSDVATRRYLRGHELVLLMSVAVLESCGYRQLNAWWGVVGTLQACTGTGGWGPMTRRGFEG